MSPSPDVDTVIIGAGFSGLGMAAQLRARGERDFVVLDKADRVGGTWRDNAYPGCACDIPSHLYSFSFDRNPGWSRWYAPQEEILGYLEGVVDRHGLAPHLRLSHRLTGARFDADAGLWRLEIAGRPPLTARFLVLGVGGLHRPSTPALPGLDSFAGPAFHSARWDPSFDPTGKRVAVIGTGASAVQLVPRLAARARSLHLFQRTPPWVLPKPDRAIGALERRLLGHSRLLQRLYRYAIYWRHEARALAFTADPRLMELARRAGLAHLARQVPDPALRAKLTPDYTPGCKRILLANDYYPALTQPHVEVVTEPVREVTASGLVTTDGRAHDVDVVVFATGFKVHEPIPRGVIHGLGGQELVAAWEDAGVEAYKGVAVAGFPNAFVLMGPNTGLGHNSMVFMIEAQIRYTLRAMDALRRRGGRFLDVRRAAQRAWTAALGPRLSRSVWGSGCQSWYLDDRGHNPTVWPGSTLEYWWRTRRFDADRYDFAEAR